MKDRPYDGYTWAELVAFQTGLDPEYLAAFDRMPLEARLLDVAGMLASDAGQLSARAIKLLHASQGLPFGTPDAGRTRAEMARCLAWMLGHLIDAARLLDADVLSEFDAWSRELPGEPGLKPKPAAE